MALASLRKLFESGTKQKYKKGTVIHFPKSQDERIYFIAKGYVVAYALQEKNKKIFIVLKKEEIFPIIWGLSNTKKNLYFEALSDTEVLGIPKQTFSTAVNTDIAISKEIIQLVTQYLSSYVDRVANLELSTAKEKVISRILFFKNRFGEKKNGHVVLTLPLTHQLIADSLNLTRETVTRELKKLEDEKIIFFRRKRMIVRNVGLLQSLVYSLFLTVDVSSLF